MLNRSWKVSISSRGGYPFEDVLVIADNALQAGSRAVDALNEPQKENFTPSYIIEISDIKSIKESDTFWSPATTEKDKEIKR